MKIGEYYDAENIYFKANIIELYYMFNIYVFQNSNPNRETEDAFLRQNCKKQNGHETSKYSAFGTKILVWSIFILIKVFIIYQC